MSSTTTITAVSTLLIIIVVATVFLLIPPSNHYWGLESNYAGETGAPDGIYQQKDWGWFNNETRIWFFAMCAHDYLGPLHGGWLVEEGQWVPEWKEGVYPIDAKLYVTLSNNTIVDVHIKSVCYGD